MERGVRILASDWAVLFEDELFSFSSMELSLRPSSTAQTQTVVGRAVRQRNLFATVGGPRNLRVINRDGDIQGTEVVHHQREHYASLVAL